MPQKLFCSHMHCYVSISLIAIDCLWVYAHAVWGEKLPKELAVTDLELNLTRIELWNVFQMYEVE